MFHVCNRKQIKIIKKLLVRKERQLRFLKFWMSSARSSLLVCLFFEKLNLTFYIFFLKNFFLIKLPSTISSLLILETTRNSTWFKFKLFKNSREVCLFYYQTLYYTIFQNIFHQHHSLHIILRLNICWQIKMSSSIDSSKDVAQNSVGATVNEMVIK